MRGFLCWVALSQELFLYRSHPQVVRWLFVSVVPERNPLCISSLSLLSPLLFSLPASHPVPVHLNLCYPYPHPHPNLHGIAVVPFGCWAVR